MKFNGYFEENAKFPSIVDRREFLTRSYQRYYLAMRLSSSTIFFNSSFVVAGATLYRSIYFLFFTIFS